MSVSEQEYIRISTLVKLRIIQSILYDIQPYDNKLIDNIQYRDMYNTIKMWIEKHETK